MKNCILGLRVEEHHRERLEELAKVTGMNLSQLFRLMIDSVEIVTTPTVKVVIEVNKVDE